jgi:hypothetical protein
VHDISRLDPKGNLPGMSNIKIIMKIHMAEVKQNDIIVMLWSAYVIFKIKVTYLKLDLVCHVI